MTRRLLVVDDDADMRLTLKLALELAGYTVEVAANAREALEVQRREPAEVLITDIFMPDADGFEAIDSFRRDFPRTKIVVVSGEIGRASCRERGEAWSGRLEWRTRGSR